MTNYSNYYDLQILKKSAIHFLYVGKNMYNLIARNCSGHGLSEEKKKQGAFHCMSELCCFIFISFLRCLYLSPHMKCARTSFLLCPLSVLSPCATRYFILRFLFLSVIDVPFFTFQRPVSIVGDDDRDDDGVAERVLFPSICMFAPVCLCLLLLLLLSVYLPIICK